MKALQLIALALLFNCGCTVVSANRVFPTLKWYWSPEAKEQRAERKAEKEAIERYQASQHPTQ